MTDFTAEKAEIRTCVEWDWVYTTGRGGIRLHHVAEMTDELGWYHERHGPAVTTCGLRGEFMVPGFFSRVVMDRCAHCCDRLGIARGIGSPKNDPNLRPWVAARLHD